MEATTISTQAEIPPRSLWREGHARGVLRHPGHCASRIYPWRTHCEQRTLMYPASLVWVYQEETKIVDWAVMGAFAWKLSCTPIPPCCWNAGNVDYYAYPSKVCYSSHMGIKYWQLNICKKFYTCFKITYHDRTWLSHGPWVQFLKGSYKFQLENSFKFFFYDKSTKINNMG